MKITDAQLDTLMELMNIGVCQAASILHDMVGSHVRLQVPSVKNLNQPSFNEEVEKFGMEKLASVKLDFSGSLKGSSLLTFPADSAAKLVEVLTGEEGASLDMDAIRVGALSEVGNIVINAIMGSIGNLLKMPIDYSIPSYQEGILTKLINPKATLIIAQIRFDIDQFFIKGDIFLLFEIDSFNKLKEAVDAMNEAAGVC